MPEHGGGGIPLYPTAACQRFDLLLPDYLEGQDHPEVTIHAANCVYCAALLEDLLLVRAEAGEMGDEEPPARLWANVRARLVEEGLIRLQRGRPVWADWFLRPATAAGLAVLLLGGFILLRSLGDLRWQHAPSVSTASRLDPQRVDPQVEASVAEMERAFEDRSSNLDPAMRAAYEEGLKALNQEIQECRSSLSRQPDDGLVREYLASAYHEKAVVLASALEAGQ
jgi:hypothetical protein